VEIASAPVDSTGHATLTVPFQFPFVSTPEGPQPNAGAVLSVGSHRIQASYSGDANYGRTPVPRNDPTVPAVTFQVTKGDTAITVTPSVNGQNTTYTALVSLSPPPTGQFQQFGFANASGGFTNSSPTGSVQFFNGATLIGTASLTAASGPGIPLATSIATLTVPVVTGTLIASYLGDNTYNGTTRAVSLPASSPTPTAVNISISPDPPNIGQPATLT